MAPTFSLADILAIVIPLGVICLASLLILGIVIIRTITASNRYKSAYEVENHSEILHNSHRTPEHRGPKSQRNSYKRSCLDIICCIPSSAYKPPQIKQSTATYAPNIARTEHDFGIPESQRRLSDASKTQSLRAKRMQNKSKDLRDSIERSRAPFMQANDNRDAALNKTKKIDDQFENTFLNRMEIFKTEGLPNKNYRNKARELVGSDTPTPDSILSIPKSMSINDPNMDFFKQQEGNKAKYPHPYAQGTRQPPASESNTSSMAHIAGSINVPDMGSFTPLPIPPGIKEPYLGIPLTPDRANSRIDYSTKDPGVQTSPSFASKLRTLTPNSQPQEFLYPAKSELRNKYSWKKVDPNADDNTSNREYFSASNSIRSNNPGDSPMSAKFSNFRNDQTQEMSSHMKSVSQNGSNPSQISTERQQIFSNPKHQKINETPLNFSSIRENDESKEIFEPFEHQTTEKMPQPPILPPSRQTQRNKVNKNYKEGSSDKDELSLKSTEKSVINRNKIPVTYPASLSNNSVVEPDRLIQELQQNEHIIEGRERSDAIRVTRGHSLVPSYSGFVVQPHTSEAQFSKYPSDILGSYQLTENADTRASYSSGSKQSTPIDKMSNYNTLLAGTIQGASPSRADAAHFPTVSATARPHVVQQPDHISTNAELSKKQPLSTRVGSTNDYTIPVSSVPPVPSKPLSGGFQTPEVLRTPDLAGVKEVKGFSKSSIQLSSPLGSPHESYVPSRHSSLSTRSLGRSRSLSSERSLKYCTSKLFDEKANKPGDGQHSSEPEGQWNFSEGESRDDNKKDAPNDFKNYGIIKKKADGVSSMARSLSISTQRNQSEQHHGTISTIAALNPPASPRSPGYEPSRGALINSPPVQRIDKPGIQTSSQRPAIKKNLDDQHKPGGDAQLEKKAAMKSRINKPLPSTPIMLEDGVVSHLRGAKFWVIASYKSRLSDEIDLEVGDVLKVNEVFDDNWCRARVVQSSVPTAGRNLRGVCPKACLSSEPI